jgi:hypothetical protein
VSLTAIWELLGSVGQSRMRAEGSTGEASPWRRTGSGIVRVQRTSPLLLEWEEEGSWQQDNERPTSFRNRLRWTWDVSLGTIHLHHLRRGADRPVHLVELAPDGPDRLISTVAHFCDPDRYQAEMILSDGALELRWEVSGPGKQYSLSTRYLP